MGRRKEARAEERRHRGSWIEEIESAANSGRPGGNTGKKGAVKGMGRDLEGNVVRRMRKELRRRRHERTGGPRRFIWRARIPCERTAGPGKRVRAGQISASTGSQGGTESQSPRRWPTSARSTPQPALPVSPPSPPQPPARCAQILPNAHFSAAADIPSFSQRPILTPHPILSSAGTPRPWDPCGPCSP